MTTSPLPRVVLHLDMDAFYAAVEVREDPSLAGKPLIIGHLGRRGVVSTCSYEARKFGVHSAMPSVTARRLCPQGVWRVGRMELYVEVSRRIRAILDDASPLVEPLSIDEAFLDFTGIARDLEGGRQAAAELKERIHREQRLTASVGVAPNKFLAKVASDLEKPDGLVVFPLEEVPARLWPMPVERLWGWGPRTAERLRAAGFATIGAIAQSPEGRLEQRIGARLAGHLRKLARGEDFRTVEGHRGARSISEERTYGHDLTDADRIDRALLERAVGVGRQLRRKNLVARTVQLKVRTGDFTTWTRSVTLRESTDLAETIVAAARDLFAHGIRLEGRGVRLLGVGVSGLEPRGAGQSELFPDPTQQRAHRLAEAADAVRKRFGRGAVTRARLLRKAAPEGDDDDEASSLPSVD
jgi:DNA polymerase-4